MSPALRLGAVGFGLIAVCYGFARFAFGLFLPQVEAELSLGPALAGLISGGAFLVYCLAIAASAVLTERVGPRAVAVGAALAAAAGMAGIAAAPDAPWLAAAVLLAGLSTGLASPPMAAAVAADVRAARQDVTNTLINAGTSAGVALSGAVALGLGGQWRLAFAAFAVAALVLAVAAGVAVPARGAGAAVPRGLPPWSAALSRLVLAAFLTGAASTALWSFGGQLLEARPGWGGRAGALWMATGAAGIAGAWAGSLTARFGIDAVHRAGLGVMAAGILAVGAGPGGAFAVLAGGALFGAAYVMLTGVYLVWGVAALPARPATGLMIGFLVIAVGQSAGAPLFGLLSAHFGAGPAAIAFALLGVLAGLAGAGRHLAPAPPEGRAARTYEAARREAASRVSPPEGS
ncbi:YbfB/YjiJ family MFS transporter [Paroceanicella profunda]|uniref:YbfB/YjiJ family MFS transporter n=1 Tax=Paroceanicella profunda TaxID=2579971 RepID=A0A5B8G0P1_9RHOB|nr:MFS transporter [Paroceanicella profunda]QDL91993.1 YbfB/YjiJ family MFS transporter [Paroceanicella profunda]